MFTALYREWLGRVALGTWQACIVLLSGSSQMHTSLPVWWRLAPVRKLGLLSKWHVPESIETNSSGIHVFGGQGMRKWGQSWRQDTTVQFLIYMECDITFRTQSTMGVLSGVSLAMYNMGLAYTSGQGSH